MKNKKIVLIFREYIHCLFLILITSTTLLAQTTAFQRKIDIVNNDYAFAVVQTPADSGFILATNNYDWSTGTKLSLIKTDKLGNVVWIKGNSSLANAGIKKMQYTSDGGVVMFGSYYGSYPASNGIIIKADNTGSITWSKTIGPGKEQFFSGQSTSDGGYIMAGSTGTYGQKGKMYPTATDTATDLYLAKVNSVGALLWTKTYGVKNSNETGFSVFENTDGNLIVVGETTDTNYNKSGYIIKTNSNGDSLWTKIYHNNFVGSYNSYSTGFQSVKQTTDLGYILMGSAYDSIPGFDYPSYYTSLVKMDNSGNIQWNKLYYGTYDYMDVDYYSTNLLGSVYQTPEKGYIIGLQADARYYKTCYLIKTDSVGSIKWSRYPGSAHDYGPNVYGSFIPVLEGGYVLTGQSYDVLQTPQASGYNNIDVFLMKTDTSGKVGSCYNTPITGVYSNTLIPGWLNAIKSSGGSASASGTGGTANMVYFDSVACMPYPIVADFYPGAACIGASTGFYNSSNGSFFQWDFGDPGSGSNNTSNLPNPPAHTYSSVGTYTITLIVADGDYNTADTTYKTYTLLPDKFINLGSDVTICYGDSTQLSASGALWYSDWHPGLLLRDSTIINPYTTATSSQSYSKSGNNGGCYDTNTVNVIIRQTPPAILISANSSVCVGYPTILSTAMGDRFLWSNGATTDSITVVPKDYMDDPGWQSYTTSYSVTTSYNGKCINDTSITITVTNRSAPVLLLDNTTICEGESLVLFGSGSTDFSWSPADGLSDTSVPNPLASPSSNTTYLFITYSGVCADTASAFIGVVPSPTLSTFMSNSSICSGNTITLGVNGNGTFLWSNGSTDAVVIVKPLKSADYTVEVNNGICTSKQTIPVLVSPPLIANAGPDVSMLCGSSTTLSGNGGISFSWTPDTLINSTNTNTTLFNALTPGKYSYSLTVSLGLGCESVADAVIITVSNITANAGQDVSICSGATVDLNGAGGLTFAWSPGNGISSTDNASAIFSLSTPGSYTYSLMVASGVGCESLTPDSVTITVIAVPTVYAGTDLVLPQNTSDTLFAWGNALEYSWSPSLCTNCLSPIVGPISSTTQYILTANNGNNCIATDTVVVVFKPYECEVFIPDAFSPNGDGINDKIKVESYCIQPNGFSFRIYDRWGTLVFETFEQDKSWDGNFLNEPLTTSAVFVYVVTGKTIYQDDISKKGNISLIK